MGKTSDRSRSGSGGSGARAPVDPTIALSDSEILPLDEIPPAPPAKQRPRPVPGDASVWLGRVLNSDEFAPSVQPKRRRRPWLLVALLAVVAGAAGLYQWTSWFDPGSEEASPASAAKPAETVPTPPAETAPARPAETAPTPPAETALTPPAETSPAAPAVASTTAPTSQPAATKKPTRNKSASKSTKRRQSKRKTSKRRKRRPTS